MLQCTKLPWLRWHSSCACSSEACLGSFTCLAMELKDLTGHTLLERSDQPECWTEHSTQLYDTEVPFKNQALYTLDQMPVADHLDNHPNFSEVISTSSRTRPGKAPGIDVRPSEMPKLDTPHLTWEIHHIMCLCWKAQYLKDAQLITLLKTRDQDKIATIEWSPFWAWWVNFLGQSSKADCRYWWTEYPESQCDFSEIRLTIDMVLTLRRLQGKCIEQNKPLYIMFIDLTKDFSLWVGLDCTKTWRRLVACQKYYKWSALFMTVWLQE